MSRWASESGYLLRYLGSGLVNTAVGFAIIFLMTWLGAPPTAANIAGYAAGLCISFFLSRRLVFRSEGRWIDESLRYLKAFFVAFALNLVALHVALRAGFPPLWAQLLAACTYTGSMYLLSRLVVFKPSSQGRKP